MRIDHLQKPCSWTSSSKAKWNALFPKETASQWVQSIVFSCLLLATLFCTGCQKASDETSANRSLKQLEQATTHASRTQLQQSLLTGRRLLESQRYRDFAMRYAPLSKVTADNVTWFVDDAQSNPRFVTFLKSLFDQMITQTPTYYEEGNLAVYHVEGTRPDGSEMTGYFAFMQFGHQWRVIAIGPGSYTLPSKKEMSQSSQY